jgi:hypothetical protein
MGSFHYTQFDTGKAQKFHRAGNIQPHL